MNKGGAAGVFKVSAFAILLIAWLLRLVSFNRPAFLVASRSKYSILLRPTK